MNILYGVQLNGNGHITRSSVLIDRLRRLGHSVSVLTSGTKSNLKIDSDFSYDGINLYYTQNGSVDWLKTISELNLLKLNNDIKEIEGYDLVISDFEPISAWSAKISNIKSIGISNQYAILEDNAFFLNKKIIEYFAPCDYYIPITYDGEFKPIIRNELIDSKIVERDYYLIYLPNIDYKIVIDVISKFGNYFKLYVNEDGITSKFDNVEVIKIDNKSFIDDLVQSKGVITQSGFSTTSECLVLGKKLWSIPIKGQYEQVFNSKKLKKMGFFVSDFNTQNMEIWLNSFSKVDYEWENPIDKIIRKIYIINEIK